MKRNILNIGKINGDLVISIPRGTSGYDLELGLAHAISEISEYQRSKNPDFKDETLIEAIKVRLACLKQEA